MLSQQDRIRVLFVCLGNICRSPTAEGIFLHLVAQKNLSDRFFIDSCGTGGWHTGEPPHPKTQIAAKKKGIDLASLRARQLAVTDFDQFDYIIAMDQQNFADIKSLSPGGKAKIFLLRDYDPLGGDLDVPDPYYAGGFDAVFEIIHRSCEKLLGFFTAES